MVAAMPAKPLTEEQQEDARRLREAFQAFQARMKAEGSPISQEAAAGLLPFGQSALNQYLLGKIPLNAEALLSLSSMLGVSPMEISPSITRAQIEWSLRWVSPKDVLAQRKKRASDESGKPGLPADALALAHEFDRLKGETREQIFARLVNAIGAAAAVDDALGGQTQTSSRPTPKPDVVHRDR